MDALASTTLIILFGLRLPCRMSAGFIAMFATLASRDVVRIRSCVKFSVQFYYLGVARVSNNWKN